MTDNIDKPRETSGPGRALAVVAVMVVVALGIAWAAGLFNVDASGSLEAPDVSVSGGEVPNVQVETADIDVGTKTETVEVPTVSVTRPGDDGNAQQ